MGESAAGGWFQLVLGIGRDFNIDNWLLNIDQYID